MEFRNRIGTFLVFIGFILLFIFFASLFSPSYNYGAFLVGVFLVVLGWPMSRGRQAAPPPKPAAPPPKPAAPPPKKQGLLTTILKGPSKKAPPPPPKPAAPPPPPPKKGLAALFGSKPKKK